MPLAPRPRRPLSSSPPDHHTGTAAEIHGARDILEYGPGPTLHAANARTIPQQSANTAPGVRSMYVWADTDHLARVVTARVSATFSVDAVRLSGAFGRLKNWAGLALLRVRRITKVAVHADL